MRLLCVAALAAFCCAAVQAAEPSKAQIVRWLGDVGKVELGDARLLTLKGGEKAYLVPADFPDQGSNFTQGYVLARPALGKAVVLKDFGGQNSDVTVLSHDSRNGYMVILGSSSSGQGIANATHSVVLFEGWKPRVLFAADEGNNFGDCGDEGKACEGSQVFLNPLADPDDKHQLAVTTVRYAGTDERRAKVSISAKVVTLSYPK
ncbi:hypothetical protein CXB49_08060 [Chromobacterium sp. ATCC 53434]|uniref:hypothetical protein n=1 Tax=Chromobacterium sp. (strain ATCC 53434 / SC 14030) TaxID=2059672 RepID=UPI000C78A931|nr:hypothetical protein [Chromobacterium sp. ATCC 53434]AUH50759.1 hypothetical protein CXB49_08060 [Chromobacterium sp. ATCC 53434]